SFNWYDPSNNLVGTTSTLTIPNTTPDGQGVYTIFVTDDYGCENSATIDIDIQEVLLADAGNDQLVCNNTTTVLDAETPSGGMGTWSVTQGSGNFEDINDPHTLVTGLSIGQNSFLWTVDPENNCSSSSDEVLITVGLPNISVSSNSPICQGATLILTGEGNNIVSYTWNGPSGVTGSGQELSINSTLPEDSGIYQLSVTDIFGCSSTTTAEIIIEPNPIVNAGIDQFACSDAEIILNANLPAGTVGHWNIVEGNGVISDVSDPFSLFTNQAPFENVTLSWTLISSIGCTDIDTVLLNYIDQSPPAFAGVDFAACQSEPFLILNATPPGNGQGSWSVFEGMADFEDESNPASKITNFSPGTAGTLVLQWKITDQCHLGLPSAEDYITITIDQPSGPALLLTQDVNLCQTTELIIAADDNYLGQGEWTLLSGSGTIANSSNPMTLITNLSIGIPITLQWAVVNGVCPVKSATLNIQVDPLPDAALVGLDQQICNETDFSLNASPVDVGQGIWRIVEGIGNIQDEKDPASHVTGLVPGSDVSLVWEVSSGICPVSIDTVVIRNNALPDEARLGADLQICNAQVLNISANEPTSGSGMWSVIEGSVHVNSPTDANTFLDGLVSDSLIKVTWTISNGVCPSSIDTLQIINYQLPDGAHAGDDIMACVDSVWLSAQSILVGSGIWEIVQGDGQIANKKSNQTLLSDLPNNESVVLTWTVSNGVCPIQQDTIVISTAKNFLEAHAGDDLYPCSAESILLNAESAPEGTTAAWKIISGPGQVRNPSASSSWIDDLISGQQTTVAWTLSEGICPEVADTIIIDNLDGANLNANFLINQAACLGDSLAIIDVSNIPESSDIEFIWTSNGDVISNERDPVIIFDESGLKNIQLEIRIGACSSMSPVKEINILDCLIEDQDSTVKYNNVSAFPNPTTGKVRVEIEQIEGESLLMLYDAAGRLLLDEKLIGNSISKELNLEQPGFYFIQIINPKFEKVIKILKL
ncbi:MAG TPA: T9SS type A sorting domain-containing protein, partial [Saprospiraceae bacterium]|nr:T9SS type A sorting domain-containing protein [Saprospiraceae bacterium]